MGKNHFYGRSITVARDFSVDEQAYLYKKTGELKERFLRGEDLSSFKLNDPLLTLYLVFLENSTRTKESFRNAARFHNVTLNDFDAEASSFKKMESYSDTFKMLAGYCPRSLFVIRSPEEGVCRMLDEYMGEYAALKGYEKPLFINGGDGKHEHPTQEFLDQFTFLEKQKSRKEIHIALLGDLLHGRTAHSKADGLSVFENVKIDLIAPKELEMPPFYLERMRENGFEISCYPSIDAYFEQKEVAPLWYFTRLQLERMGDSVKDKEKRLRQSVTFREDLIERLPAGACFYHPLPRHKVYPTIPSFLDNTPLNGWDEQSRNGLFTRIVEIAMITGKIGDDFEGEPLKKGSQDTPFIEEVKVDGSRKERHSENYKVGIKPVESGIVIDHIARGKSPERIWNKIDQIRQIMGLNCRSSHGVYTSERENSTCKGIISLPEVGPFNERQMKMISAIAPESTLNIVRNRQVAQKYRLHMPPRIYKFDETSCKNRNCISHPDKCEPIHSKFYRNGKDSFSCKYCDKSHLYDDIWDY